MKEEVEWIDPKVKLPEEYVEVLVKLNEERPTVGYLTKAEGHPLFQLPLKKLWNVMRCVELWAEMPLGGHK